MRVLTLQAFGKMAVEERPDPVAGDGEVLIATIATGICGSDLHGYTGENGRRFPGQVMGHETVGRIVALGPSTRASDLMVGQVVTFNPVIPCGECEPSRTGDWQHCADRILIGVDPSTVAAFAQFVAVPEANVISLSEQTPVAYGALVEPLAVAFHAARRAQVDPGANVLVVGGGPIGQSVVLAVRRLGAKEVIVSEVDAARRELCERLGAVTIDPSASNVADQVIAVFGGLADVAIDAVGIEQTLADALRATKFGAQICIVGMGAPTIQLDAYRISTEERSLVGSFTYSAGDFRDAVDWVSTNPAELGELISREVSLDEGADAFAKLAAHDGTPGKVLIRFSE